MVKAHYKEERFMICMNWESRYDKPFENRQELSVIRWVNIIHMEIVLL